MAQAGSRGTGSSRSSGSSRHLRATALLAAAALGCPHAPPTFRIAPGHEGAPGVERVLLVPTNLVIALRPELEAGVEPVQAEIAGYLERQGRAVERLSLVDARRDM